MVHNERNILFKIVIASVIFIISAGVHAQTGIIKGKITDSKTKESLIGASVLLVGTQNGVAADLEGNFILRNVKPGKQSLSVSYIGYNAYTKTDIVVQGGRETVVNISLNADSYSFKEVEVVAKSNRESENILLLEQKKSLLATQAVGAKEMSRKGAGDAEAAVSQVSGVSKQEGVKNVFVRGLGDRYNATLLNGFPVPSEDPEYKNIALDFFSTDMIQNIGVSKVFDSSNQGDVGGAVININSKELQGSSEFGIDVSAGMNAEVNGIDFLHPAGSDYLGFSNSTKPQSNTFNFHNSLDPSVVSHPINHGFGIAGGKLFHLGKDRNPLSFFIVGAHETDYSYTSESVRNTTTIGTVFQDQIGTKYSQTTNQLVLANVTYGIRNRHQLSYNFMMLHANNQYVGEFNGFNGERYQDSEDNVGFMKRQQTNDNLLLTHQLLSDWKLSEKLNFNIGVAYNTIKGLEPDRRVNNLSKQVSGQYIFTGSNRQQRFFSELKEEDFNIKSALQYKLHDAFEDKNSSLVVGYDARFVDDNFNAIEYNYSAYPGVYSLDNLKFDELYNQTNFTAGLFTMREGYNNRYHVAKYIHSGYLQGNYQLASGLLANVGLRFDYVDLSVDHHIEVVVPGKETIRKNYFLPSVNLKYDLNDKNALRLGISKTYTLPQSKEISPYQYVNIGFASQGNPNLEPSDNYNVDLKWDNYLSPSELFSLTGFFKYIQNPIGRVDQGNSAGLLTYENISHSATVGGVELELRKNLINQTNSRTSVSNKLSFGLNASYIYTNLQTEIENTPKRNSQLEGAAPFIANFDFSYSRANKKSNFLASVVANYVSDKIYTIGTMGYKDIIEEGIPTLDFISSCKLNNHFTVKLKVANLLNPSYKLSRKSSTNDNETIILDEYKKGLKWSVGFHYDL